MLRSIRYLALGLLMPALALAAPPATPGAGMTVSTNWLAAHLDDPDLVLLHVGDRDEYATAHIPGARHVSLDDIALSDHSGKGLMLELPAADELRDRLAALGIADDSQIVVYFGSDWVSPTTRVLFTLDAAGLGARSALLDGGMAAWVRERHETTDAIASVPKRGVLSPLKMRPIVVDAAFVRAHQESAGFVLVDARSREFYDGTETGASHAGPHETGHIPGARSLPFNEVTREDLMLKSPQELRSMFDAIGVKPGDTVIGYCHIGQQATAMLFAARLLGHPVLLYDGSFEDWSRRKLPVETATGKTVAR
jgi:thiosulfate/3-mercaptopyruvate sulfurtransferase